MDIIEGLDKLRPMDRPTAVTIGVYDGVHLGHQAIIRRCVERAKSFGGTPVVVTFEPMPISVIDPSRAPLRITTLTQKSRLLSDLGVEVMLVIDFDAAFASMSAREFADAVLCEALKPKAVVVGSDFRFGKDRKGDVRLLRELMAPKGIEVEAVDLISLEGSIVSSTRIRTLLNEGKVETASKLLGRHPVVEGRVVGGVERGRVVGFPTANLHVENPGSLPCCGVYSGMARVDMRNHPAVVYVGYSPTFEDVLEKECHVHLIGFEGNIYGRRLEVQIQRKLRDERRFEGVEALRNQIQKDVAKAKLLAEADSDFL